VYISASYKVSVDITGLCPSGDIHRLDSVTPNIVWLLIIAGKWGLQFEKNSIISGRGEAISKVGIGKCVDT